MRGLIVAAALALASPAWANESYCPRARALGYQCVDVVAQPVFSDGTAPNALALPDWVEDDHHVTSLQLAPHAVYSIAPDFCLGGNTIWAAKDGKCEPTPRCPKGQGWEFGDGCAVKHTDALPILSDPSNIGPTGTITVREYAPCDPGYALLAYPGTWKLVCARDVREPK